jgi:transposase
MEIVHSRCARMDVSKRDAKVCVRVAGKGRGKTVEAVRTWGSTTNAILALREHLINEQVSLVVMEATGDYWKPFYYLLEGADFEVLLVNARHVKNLPGRKSDVSDAAWLAQLGAHGLVHGSFVRSDPAAAGPDPGPHSDDQRTRAGDPTAGEAVGGRRDQTVLGGQRHHLPVRPVDAARVDRWPTRPGRAGRPGQETPARQDPGVDRGAARPVQRPHAFLAGMYLDAIDQRSRQIAELTARIEVVIEPFRSFCALIGTIPGIGERSAEVIVAETGANMSIFPTAAHLASWAGTCPGSNESAGRVKSTATRPGNPYLKAALGAAALSIANSHGTYLAAKYRRIAARRGPKKALVAIEHAILVAIWNMAHTGALYDDPGADYYTRRDPERARRNAVNQLQRLGYQVTLTPAAASA